MIGPVEVPRPPMTSMVTYTLIGVRPMTVGAMLPSADTYRPPAMPARKPDIGERDDPVAQRVHARGRPRSRARP